MTDFIRLIIAGSRGFKDYELLEREVSAYLQEILKEKCKLDLVTDGEGNWGWCNWEQQVEVLPKELPLEIVSGGARGADRLGERYARERDYNLKVFNADWEKKGRGAGMIRNIEMLKYSTHCLVFWDGVSKGTKHTIENAKKYNVKIRIIGFVSEFLTKDKP